jgi:hypothetical protein
MSNESDDINDVIDTLTEDEYDILNLFDFKPYDELLNYIN